MDEWAQEGKSVSDRGSHDKALTILASGER